MMRQGWSTSFIGADGNKLVADVSATAALPCCCCMAAARPATPGTKRRKRSRAKVIQRMAKAKRSRIMRKTSRILLGAAAGAALTLFATQPNAIFSIASAKAAAEDTPSVPCVYAESNFRYTQAQIVVESWRRHYNAVRPHASLGYKPPAPEVFVPALSAWPATLRRPAPPATLATLALPPGLN